MNAHSGFGEHGVAHISFPSSLLSAVLVQAAKIIVSVSKGVAQWRKGLKTNGGGARKNKKGNGTTGVTEDEKGWIVFCFPFIKSPLK